MSVEDIKAIMTEIDFGGNDIFTMKIHEQIDTDQCIVTRVPGGWLYTMIERMQFDGQQQMVAQPPTFVPFTTSDQTKQ